jgi:hypothetical protein
MTKDEQIKQLKKENLELKQEINDRPLRMGIEGPCMTDELAEQCPSWYDYCHCTVNSLRHITKVYYEQCEEIKQLKSNVEHLQLELNRNS